MRAIIDIALNDLRIILQDRSLRVNLIIVPLVLAYVIGIANGAGASTSASAPTLIIDVISQDSGAISQQFLSDLKAANPNFALCPQDNTDKDVCQLGGASLDENLAEQRLKAQTSLALIEFPANFSADVNAGKNVNLIYRSNEDASAPSYILQAVQAETQKLGGALLAEKVGSDVADNFSAVQFKDDADRRAFANDVLQKASALWAQNPVQVNYVVAQQPAGTSSSGGAGFQQSIPGIGTMYAMFIIFPAAGAIIVERKNWTLQRMATLPLSRAQILGGKLLARFSTGMLEYVLMFAFGLIFLHVSLGGDPLAVVLLAASFSLAATALMLALTTLVHNDGQARGIALFLTLTLAPLGGAWWPLDIVPNWLRIAGHISPVAWVMDGFTTITINGGHLGDVLLPIGVLLAMTAVFFAIGVSRFKFAD